MDRVKRAKHLRSIEPFIHGVLIVGAIVFFAACEGTNDSAPAPPTQSTVPDTPEADRERLLARVKEYWQARVQPDLRAAFQYETLSRDQKMEEGFYVSNVGTSVKILEFSIIDVATPLKATETPVSLQIKYEYFFPMPGTPPMEVPTQIVDRWEKDQGVWYHILDTKPLAIKPHEERTFPAPADALE